VLSTKHGVFDETIEGTVPKRELVEALAELGPVRSTDELPEGVWWFDVTAQAQGPAGVWTFELGPLLNPPSPAAGHDEGDEPG
jgi:hypothetical protein